MHILASLISRMLSRFNFASPQFFLFFFICSYLLETLSDGVV